MIFWLLAGLTLLSAEPASKEDIKQVLHFMDKRFEAVDKRFDMLMWFIGILTVLSTTVISYVVSRIGKQDRKITEVESRFEHIDLNALIRDLRNADPATKKALKAALK